MQNRINGKMKLGNNRFGLQAGQEALVKVYDQFSKGDEYGWIV